MYYKFFLSLELWHKYFFLVQTLYYRNDDVVNLFALVIISWEIVNIHSSYYHTTSWPCIRGQGFLAAASAFYSSRHSGGWRTFFVSLKYRNSSIVCTYTYNTGVLSHKVGLFKKGKAAAADARSCFLPPSTWVTFKAKKSSQDEVEEELCVCTNTLKNERS